MISFPRARFRLLRRLAVLAPCVAPCLATVHPAVALTIVPFFDSSISGPGVSNTTQIEDAINTAIGTIDSLYSNPGAVGIVFTQASGGFLGQSQSADYSMSYAAYTGALTTVSHNAPSNTVLATAIANLLSGNRTGTNGSVLLTSADGRVALGLSGMSGCFNSGGAFVNSCGQPYDGVVTLTTSFALNYGKTGVAGQYSAIEIVEHEIDEILGGGGQGTVLNNVYVCTTAPATAGCAANANFVNDVGVLDLYRYAAPGTPSFSTSGSAFSYLSADGGVTSIVAFNQDHSGDYGDFGPGGYVQSAFTGPGSAAPYTTASPEFPMMNLVGYSSVAEPVSVAVLASGLTGLGWIRRRRQRPRQ